MYDITKQIISRNNLGFNILSITNVENILLDSLVVKKKFTYKPLLLIKKTLSITIKGTKQHMAALSVF